MPHVIVKLWPGKSEQEKTRLAEEITKDVMDVLHYGEKLVSVAVEEIKAQDWAEKVYTPEILNSPEKLYIGDAVLWLCSPAASFVTGHALAVDGGFTVH